MGCPWTVGVLIWSLCNASDAVFGKQAGGEVGAG